MIKTTAILIVEDEAIVAMENKVKLTAAGYRITGIVSTAADAVEQTLAGKPDVVLMDIKLKSELTGIDAAVRIRRESQVPIIFITGNSDPRTRSMVDNIANSRILIKPIHTRDLIREIELINS